MSDHPLVLLVDDFPESLDVMGDILRDRGFRVVLAVDGEHALTVAMAPDETPDVIVMDLALPRVDGLEATRRLKADPRTTNIPVLLYTAHVGREICVLAEQAGCAAVMRKPQGIHSLVQAIERAAHPSP
jgi:two-component system cell cycle response regulator DivK